MKLLEYIEIQTFKVDPENATGFGDGVQIHSIYVLPENKEKYKTRFPDQKCNGEVDSSDIQGYNDNMWMTHPEYFYQITVANYEFEKYHNDNNNISDYLPF